MVEEVDVFATVTEKRPLSLRLSTGTASTTSSALSPLGRSRQTAGLIVESYSLRKERIGIGSDVFRSHGFLVGEVVEISVGSVEEEDPVRQNKRADGEESRGKVIYAEAWPSTVSPGGACLPSSAFQSLTDLATGSESHDDTTERGRTGEEADDDEVGRRPAAVQRDRSEGSSAALSPNRSGLQSSQHAVVTICHSSKEVAEADAVTVEVER